jgi:hypothetical protein
MTNGGSIARPAVVVFAWRRSELRFCERAFDAVFFTAVGA